MHVAHLALGTSLMFLIGQPHADWTDFKSQSRCQVVDIRHVSRCLEVFTATCHAVGDSVFERFAACENTRPEPGYPIGPDDVTMNMGQIRGEFLGPGDGHCNWRRIPGNDPRPNTCCYRPPNRNICN